MRIDSNTSVYAVFGDPISHTLSPVMHNSAFEYAGVNGVYLAFRVQDIKNAITSVRTLGIKGVSVTIPHKMEVIKYLDEIDDTVLKIGAVNTVINSEGRLKGYNSDGTGAVKALSEKTQIMGKSVAIIGAGGAARALGFCIKKEGGRITVVSRNRKKGEMLAKNLSADYRPLNDIGEIKYDILINATPAGMYPNTDEMPVEGRHLEKGMIVMDVVYNPLKTRLLLEAEKAGCITVDGVSMFVHQGAFQFELWTGIKAPLDIMKKAVLEKLNC
ncbi:MAG: shikimate dehydrogenase [Desulfobacteraceae bacterium]|nr:MAG: shikimate dehydrogenase [Desulfobacteraceae bacterium]